MGAFCFYGASQAITFDLIHEDSAAACDNTAKGSLVGVITDGSAVLGPGNVGALAGKRVLFKRFADIDVFDIEVNEDHPQEFIETVMRTAPTSGGINLEDIAPRTVSK